MGYTNCCRLCLQSLVSGECKEEYFSADEAVSDESDSTLQQVVEECFQIVFTEHETVTKVCRNCYDDVQLVDGIRKRFLAANGLLRRYYSENFTAREPDETDADDIFVIDDENYSVKEEPVDDGIEDEHTEQHIDGVRLKKEKHNRMIPAVVETNAKFPCYICETDFENIEELYQHLPSHTSTFSQVCHLCDFQVKDVRHYNGHLYLAHFKTATPAASPLKQFVCKYCGKAFPANCNLKVHENSHTKAVLYKCKFCTRFTTTRRSSLARHERTHRADRPYKCDQCDAAFTISYYLNRHRRVHSDDRPYSCTLCDATYKYSYALNLHMKKAHKKRAQLKDMHRLAGNLALKKKHVQVAKN